MLLGLRSLFETGDVTVYLGHVRGNARIVAGAILGADEVALPGGRFRIAFERRILWLRRKSKARATPRIRRGVIQIQIVLRKARAGARAHGYYIAIEISLPGNARAKSESHPGELSFGVTLANARVNPRIQPGRAGIGILICAAHAARARARIKKPTLIREFDLTDEELAALLFDIGEL